MHHEAALVCLQMLVGAMEGVPESEVEDAHPLVEQLMAHNSVPEVVELLCHVADQDAIEAFHSTLGLDADFYDADFYDFKLE